jgi:hypothetical protein
MTYILFGFLLFFYIITVQKKIMIVDDYHMAIIIIFGVAISWIFDNILVFVLKLCFV